jgi:MoaA/NifB/PqqE/SkfB family radical SAM enzyme
MSQKRPPWTRYPRYLRIGITDRCNLRCSFCAREEFFAMQGHEGEFMPFEKFVLLKRPIEEAEVVSLTGFGEPTLHPNFQEILEFVCEHAKSERPISIITNGTGFTEKKAGMIRDRIASLVFSVNAASPETLTRMMGFDFGRTISKLEIVSAGISEEDRKRVELHCVTDVNNVDEMPEFVRLAARVGFGRVRFDEYRVMREKDFELSLLHVHERYNVKLAEARDVGRRIGVAVVGNEFFSEPERIFSGELYCKSPFMETAINPHGNMAPCCYTGQWLGNVFTDGFEAVWFGSAYERLRDERYLGACKNCGVFHRQEEAHRHVGPLLKQAASIQPFVERWEKWRQSVASQSTDARHQLDLRLYEYVADTIGGSFADTFGDLIQAGMMTDFSRHYFKHHLPSSDPDEPWVMLDRALAAELEANPAVSAQPASQIGMDDMFIGGGWFVNGDAMKRGIRYLEAGWPARICLAPRAGRSIIRLGVDGDCATSTLDSLSMSVDGGAVLSKHVERRGDEPSVLWTVETDGSPACFAFSLDAARGVALPVRQIAWEEAIPAARTIAGRLAAALAFN